MMFLDTEKAIDQKSVALKESLLWQQLEHHESLVVLNRLPSSIDLWGFNLRTQVEISSMKQLKRNGPEINLKNTVRCSLWVDFPPPQ
jgi:hypothetical protein